MQFGDCLVKNVTLRNFQWRAQAYASGSLIHVSDLASVQNLVIDNHYVDDSTNVTDVPWLLIQGTANVVDIRNVTLFRTSLPGDAAIQLAGGSSAVGVLSISDMKAASYDYLVRFFGGTCGHILLNNCFQGGDGMKGVLRVSDTCTLGRLDASNINSDSLFSLDGSGTITYLNAPDGTGERKTIFRNTFRGAATTALGGTTTDNGYLWGTSGTYQVGGNLKLTGDGYVYLGGADSWNIPTAQPATGGSDGFIAEWYFRTASLLAHNELIAVTLFSDNALADFIHVQMDKTNIKLVRNTSGTPTTLATFASIPSAGTAWKLRARCTVAAAAPTITIDYSTDGGTHWAVMIAATTTTATVGAGVGIISSLGGGAGAAWSATTGPQVGGLVLRGV